jgi:hypothetical protein
MIIYCIPALILALYILIKNENNINIILLTSLTIIFFSLVNLSKFKDIVFKKDSDVKMNISLILLGIIHGFTNLGGSLLTLISANISNKKDLMRYNIASGYLILGVVQLLFINTFYNTLVPSNLYYLYIPIISFFLAQYFYNRINSQIFSRVLNIIVLIYGSYIFMDNL